ncbi:hypothetical protein BS47DRAFT_1436864 [Hydnum rufescens UP504]|uniref:Uncharacterized protein n=1 Tax=Hydnum rufescens UP504 TaxID=1448309 RepID=A0A9P6DX04_9AGAM|nr:hypothetical protein BS47DRAFT_1436864 [Hydnum rufescens UP504]
MPPFRGPSHLTGAQTPKKRRPGGRVTRADAFGGGRSSGRTLNEDLDADVDLNDEDRKKGTGYGKRASSHRAKEERAGAAERRVKQSQQKLEPDPGVEQFIPQTVVEHDDRDTTAEPVDRHKRKRLDDHQQRNEGDGPLDHNDVHATPSNDNPILPEKDVKMASVESSSFSSNGPPPLPAYRGNRQGTLATEVAKEMDRRKKEAIGLDQARTLGRAPASGLYSIHST